MKQKELKNLLVLLHNWGISLIKSEDNEIRETKLTIYETELNRLKELYPDFLVEPLEKKNIIFEDTNLNISDPNYNKKSEELIEKFKLIHKKYPIYFNLEYRKEAYIQKKMFCVNNNSNKMLEYLKDRIYHDVKYYTPVLNPPHINMTNAVPRKDWDKLAILFNLNPNEFKNKLEIHDKINQKIMNSLNGQSLSDISEADFDKKIETICSTIT